jgi:hypothetical protein
VEGDLAVTPEDIRLIDQRVRAALQTTRASGTVVTRDTTGPGATVLQDGSTVPVPAKVTGSTFVRPGDRCLMDRYGTSDWVVTQSWSTLTFGELSKTYDGLGSTTSALTSSTFVDLTEFEPTTFTKAFDLTSVRIQVQAEAYTSGSAGQTAKVNWGVRFTPIEGAEGYTPIDIGIGGININQLSTHVSYTSTRRYISLPAGTFTVSLRWRRVSGAASVLADTNDAYALELDERVRGSIPIL